MKNTVLFFTAIFMLLSPCVFADNINVTEQVKDNIEVKTNKLQTKLEAEVENKLNSEEKVDSDEENSQDKTELNSEDKKELDSEKKNSEDKKTDLKDESPEKLLMLDLEKRIGKYGSNRKDLYNYYKLAMICGEYDKADHALSRLCNLEKNNYSLLSDRIALLRIMKKYEEAEELGKKLELLDSSYVPGLINYALVCSDVGKYEEAMRLLNVADLLQPDDIKIKLNKARVESAFGNTKKAKKLLNDILIESPKYAKAINNEGVLKYNSGEKEGGEISFNEAEEVSENSDFYAEVNKAIALLNRGLYEKAYRKLYSAEEKNSNSFLLKKTMATALMYLGRYSEAYDKALEAIKLPNGKTVEILNILGASKYMNEEYDEAEEWFVQALLLEPDNAESNSNLALCFKRKALFTKAELFLNEAIKKEPHNANFYYNLATVYEGHGRNKDAIDSYKKYLELSPDTKDRKAVKFRIENLEMRDKPNPKI
ncbi:tetratricopeptide repeat protein [bacterium]|nr:tetratricopeptide repeat protein [bacterium]